MNIDKALKKGVVVFDGAIGTMLKERGLDISNSPEVYNFTHEDVVINIHKEYISSGAEIITTNTFGANRIRLKSNNHNVKDVVKKGIELASKARGDRNDVLIAYDMGPTGFGVKPTGKLEFDDAYEIFKEQAIAASENNADIILIETIIDLEEAKAAVKAVRDTSSIPIFCSFTLNNKNESFDGRSIEEMVSELDKMNVEAIGVNCSPGAKNIYKIVDIIKNSTKAYVMVEPNARYKDNEIQKEEFAAEIIKCINSGAKIVGGCCGTNPEYISEIRRMINKGK